MSAWQLHESQIATIIPKLQSQTTEQLLQIWNTEILSEYRSEETLEAVRRVLAQRGTTPPTRLQAWLKTNAVPLLVFGGVGMVILPDIMSKLLRDKPVAPLPSLRWPRSWPWVGLGLGRAKKTVTCWQPNRNRGKPSCASKCKRIGS